MRTLNYYTPFGQHFYTRRRRRRVVLLLLVYQQYNVLRNAV